MTEPFIKWVGGKRKLLKQLLPMLPPDADTLRHVEPFAGGGAMFFARRPQLALLADANLQLIQTYAIVAAEPDALLAELALLDDVHSERGYYVARAEFNARPTDPIRAAALFVYLNKTGYNGLYRVNGCGELNTPVGRYARPRIVDEPAIRACSAALNAGDVSMYGWSYERTLEECGGGDFVYLDPPYAQVVRAGFTAFQAGGFGPEHHAALAALLWRIDGRGAKFLLSNSDTAFTRACFADWRIDTIDASRSINSDGAKRGERVSEIVVRNY